MLRIGLDVGSTTVKAVVKDESGAIIYKKYERHFSKITEKVHEVLYSLAQIYSNEVLFAMSGSAGMGISNKLGVMFVQEVYATKVALSEEKKIDVAIELGGEDAKILFLSGGMEVRMNGTCAGGTGAFIDQMAALLGVTADDINTLAKKAEKIYPIASRCGVFAKSDIQPLINQGAQRADLAKSILYAIVNQTVGGLAQGRKIEGSVIYLGGPLTFFSELRDCFDSVLGLKGIFKENSLYFVASGAAMMADTPCRLTDLLDKIKDYGGDKTFNTLNPLFASSAEYAAFKQRHAQNDVARGDINTYTKNAYIGIDSGSTTIKMAVIGQDGELLDSRYLNNQGNPVTHVKDYLQELYLKYPSLNLVSGASTGYGEDLIKSAFDLEGGIVETAAHFTAAKSLMPAVNFVIDIGGQDIKCFKIKNGAVDDIFLNEACSSGCGSFLKTISDTLSYSVQDFAQMALFAKSPVDLGSRCTVFMNSSIKQAQKDGAGIENISAGLAVSVIKNALYKVIRVRDKNDLGKNIVVQGGTFLSDAVLRAFENELDVEVIRPSIAGLMGAYGAALYIKSIHEKGKKGIINAQELKNFKHETKNARCGLCPNSCFLTVNLFEGGRKYVSGNKCERPVLGSKLKDGLDIFDFKIKKLTQYINQNNAQSPSAGNAPRGTIGLPLGLNMYELLPFWHTFFTRLGFKCVVSPISDGETFKKGQTTIPSDTVCYPAKLVHGHIQSLIDMGVENIFYPCLSYNFDEHISNNHFNCPVVAYYPQVIGISVEEVKKTNFIQCFIDLNKKSLFAQKIFDALRVHFKYLTLKEIKAAARAAFKSDIDYMKSIRQEGESIIKQAREAGLEIVVLAGRPYHADPEVNHGIPQLILGMNKAVISEDCLPLSPVKTSVLNQWTYHARLYSAADYVGRQKDMLLVQMISFGCGLDAVTSDEVRRHLELNGKLYTQLKIDEITNLGAVKIRLKSLFAALNNKGGLNEHHRL